MYKDILNVDCSGLGESTMNRTVQFNSVQVQLWYNRFNEGQEDVNDHARPD